MPTNTIASNYAKMPVEMIPEPPSCGGRDH